MMNHFRGRNTLVKMMILKQFILFFFLGAFVMARGENPIVELSSREDLVHIAGYGEEKLSTVTIYGQVLCHACMNEKPRLPPQPVPGASVAVFCGNNGKRRKSWIRSTTNSYGEFLIDLPSHLHAIPNLEKICHVQVLQIPKNSLCRLAFTGKHKGIKLSSIDDGVRIYTAQTIHLTSKPSKLKHASIKEARTKRQHMPTSHRKGGEKVAAH